MNTFSYILTTLSTSYASIMKPNVNPVTQSSEREYSQHLKLCYTPGAVQLAALPKGKFPFEPCHGNFMSSCSLELL